MENWVSFLVQIEEQLKKLGTWFKCLKKVQCCFVNVLWTNKVDNDEFHYGVNCSFDTQRRESDINLIKSLYERNILSYYFKLKSFEVRLHKSWVAFCVVG